MAAEPKPAASMNMQKMGSRKVSIGLRSPRATTFVLPGSMKGQFLTHSLLALSAL